MSVNCANTKRAKSGYCLTSWQQTVKNVSEANPGLPIKEISRLASIAYHEANPDLPVLSPEEKAEKARKAKISKDIRNKAFELGWIVPGQRVTSEMRNAILNAILQGNDNTLVRVPFDYTYTAPTNVGAPIPARAPARPHTLPVAQIPHLQPIPGIIPLAPLPEGSGIPTRKVRVPIKRRPVAITAAAYGPMPKLASSNRPTQYPALSY